MVAWWCYAYKGRDDGQNLTVQGPNSKRRFTKNTRRRSVLGEHRQILGTDVSRFASADLSPDEQRLRFSTPVPAAAAEYEKDQSNIRVLRTQ